MNIAYEDKPIEAV